MNGADPGWHRIGYLSGGAAFGASSTWSKSAAGLGALDGGPTGGDRLDGLSMRRDLQPDVRVNDEGYPSLTHGPPVDRPVPREIPVGDPRANPVDNPPLLGEGPPPGLHPEKFERLQNPLDVAINAGNAAKTVTHFDDPLNHAFALTLEQNDDGRVRALLGVYDAYRDDSGQAVIDPSYGYLAPDGNLRISPMRFRMPASGIMSPSYYTVAQR